MNARFIFPVLALAAAVAAAVGGYRSLSSRGAGDPGSPPPDAIGGRRAPPGGGGLNSGWNPGSAASSPADPGPAPMGAGTAGSGAEPMAGTSGGPGEPGGGARGAEERLSDEMHKLVRDLEFTPGQKEPLQQVPVPQPEPWRSDPEREGPPPELQSLSPARGSTGGGQRVEIRGRNLRVVQVMFGAVPADLIAASGSVVVVASPQAAAGPATVTVTNDDGTWASAPQPYVYGE